MKDINIKFDPLTWWKNKTKSGNDPFCSRDMHPKLGCLSALIATKSHFLNGYFGGDPGWFSENERF